MGHSGVGKSTLAGWFVDNGFPLLADDVAVVDFADDGPVVLPGLPKLRLWDSVLKANGRDPAQFALSFEGDPSYDKRDVFLPPGLAVQEPRPLALVVQLSHSGPAFEQVHGAAAVEALVSNTYRGAFVREVQATHDHWSACVRLAQQAPVSRASVAFDLNALTRSYGPLLDAVRRTMTETSAEA